MIEARIRAQKGGVVLVVTEELESWQLRRLVPLRRRAGEFRGWFANAVLQHLDNAPIVSSFCGIEADSLQWLANWFVSLLLAVAGSSSIALATQLTHVRSDRACAQHTHNFMCGGVERVQPCCG